MHTIHLTTEDNMQIERLLQTLVKRYKSPAEEAFLLMANTYALHLPERLLLAINQFRYSDDHNGTFLLRGFHIDDAQLGETPNTVSREIDEFSAIREGFMLMLVISLIGDAFGWSSQREGGLINNVLPVRAHEGEQLSTGSTVDLDWHTEEAFHPYRADYIALMCLRNPDDVPTLVSSIRDIEIDDVIKKVLFSPRYIFHVDKNFQNGMFDDAPPEPVLFGDFSAPYVKIDPSFMTPVPGDEDAHHALQQITTAFNNSMSEIALQQGDILFMDNYRVVHGRKAFVPRFDGTDRWLKRVNVTVDLRKSRAMRKAHNSRIIITN